LGATTGLSGVFFFVFFHFKGYEDEGIHPMGIANNVWALLEYSGMVSKPNQSCVSRAFPGEHIGKKSW